MKKERKEDFMSDDTIKLLRECDAGIKMGISSLDDVIDRVENEGLKEILNNSREIHTKLEQETKNYLEKYNDDGKEPAAMAKAMSKIKTEFKTMGENNDPNIADLITDGCDMGVKSLYRYLNQYPAAEDEIKNLVHRTIETEETLRAELRKYL